MPPTIAIANRTSFLKDPLIIPMVDAVRIQVNRDFAPIYGLAADFVFVGLGKEAPDGAWLMAILDTADQAHALGYHDVTREGLPLGKVFAKTTLDAGEKLSVCLSHETLEILGDPEINICAQVGNRFYAYEVCDPCEADQYGYEIGGQTMSDFITPAWFRPTTHVKGPFDFMGKIKKPLSLLKGGYLQHIDLGAGVGWQQVTAETAHAALRSQPGSRRERRRVGAAVWERSVKH